MPKQPPRSPRPPRQLSRPRRSSANGDRHAQPHLAEIPVCFPRHYPLLYALFPYFSEKPKTAESAKMRPRDSDDKGDYSNQPDEHTTVAVSRTHLRSFVVALTRNIFTRAHCAHGKKLQAHLLALIT